MASTTKNSNEMYFVMVYDDYDGSTITTATMYNDELDVLKMLDIGGVSIHSYWIATKITNNQIGKFVCCKMAVKILAEIRNWAGGYDPDGVQYGFEIAGPDGVAFNEPTKNIALAQKKIKLKCPGCNVIYDDRECRNDMVIMDGQNWVIQKKCMKCSIG